MAGAVMGHVNIDSLAIVANMERVFTGAQNGQCTFITLSCIIQSKLSHSTAYASVFTSEMIWG